MNVDSTGSSEELIKEAKVDVSAITEDQIDKNSIRESKNITDENVNKKSIRTKKDQELPKRKMVTRKGKNKKLILEENAKVSDENTESSETDDNDTDENEENEANCKENEKLRRRLPMSIKELIDYHSSNGKSIKEIVDKINQVCRVDEKVSYGVILNL
jgi:hypothetical protein